MSCVASCPVSFDAADLPVTVSAPAGLRGVRSGGDTRRLLHLVWRHAGSLLSQHQLINVALHIIDGAVACTNKFHARCRQSPSIEARQDAAAKAGKALRFERHIALRIASRRCCDATFSCRRRLLLLHLLHALRRDKAREQSRVSLYSVAVLLSVNCQENPQGSTCSCICCVSSGVMKPGGAPAARAAASSCSAGMPRIISIDCFISSGFACTQIGTCVMNREFLLQLPPAAPRACPTLSPASVSSALGLPTDEKQLIGAVTGHHR